MTYEEHRERDEEETGPDSEISDELGDDYWESVLESPAIYYKIIVMRI